MFWIAKLNVDNYPVVLEIQHKATKDEALTVGVQMAIEHGAPDNADAIRKELDDEGVYIPEKHAFWSVCMGEADVPL